MSDFRPLGSRLQVEMLKPEETTAGGIVIPDVAQPLVGDGAVLAVGPGRILPTGERYPMTLEMGDRVVARPAMFTALGDGTHLIDDADVIAVRAWQEDTTEDRWGDLWPWNDYVMLAPDPHEPIRELPSGVLVATNALHGANAREARRGYELYEELQALGKTDRYRDEPSTYYRHRRVWDYLDALGANDMALLGEAIDQQGDTGWKSAVAVSTQRRPRVGRVLAVGPGRVTKHGVRQAIPYAGARVRWEDCFSALWVGDRLFMPARFLIGTED